MYPGVNSLVLLGLIVASVALAYAAFPIFRIEVKREAEPDE